ncbi:PepSY-associated TM helix domain-containing protein [Sphingomonas sanxanigenens]|uniref:Peptidase n=1 Tax=Sphingomonas sanxanigenens DSM 19645 = NX02 TaxID=1123269 RepID=W0AGD6_9SPHN|nr:PepSY-associated TM helix domain-containing protein [Sphingomonas sanxanigenens]AHE54715.1 hypothetical protein NX02_15160 [Sphingomonas sanxanigenens DSM 19645 = NX02]
MGIPADIVRRALAGHAAIGLLAGGLLYLLCLSGTLIVVQQEWQRWEQPNQPEAMALEPEAIDRALAAVLAADAGKKPSDHVFVHMPNAGLPRTVITTDHQAVYIDRDGSIAGPEAHGWTEFVIGLHYYLHLPSILGLTVVGALGVMMAALSVGGVIAHPRIFRDAFRLRARGSRQLAYADWHNRLGVWTLPFGLAVSITGALLGLATVMAFAIAASWYGGNVERVFEPVFGGEPAFGPAPTALPSMVRPLDYMARHHPDLRPDYIILHDPGTPRQFVQILAEHPRRLIFGDYYEFDAAGAFRRTRHMSDGEMGKQFSASVYKLHFGSFGGLPVKLIYILLGAATTIVSATGMSIWLIKRRARGKPSPRLEGVWCATLWGAPLMLALAFVLRTAAGKDAPMVALFWIGLALLIGIGTATARARPLATALRGALAALLAGIGIAHAAAMAPIVAGPLVIDLALLLTGVALAPWAALRMARGAPRGEMAPAE